MSSLGRYQVAHWVDREARGPSMENGQEPRQSRAQRARPSSLHRRSLLRTLPWSRLCPHTISAGLQCLSHLPVWSLMARFLYYSPQIQRLGLGLLIGLGHVLGPSCPGWQLIAFSFPQKERDLTQADQKMATNHYLSLSSPHFLMSPFAFNAAILLSITGSWIWMISFTPFSPLASEAVSHRGLQGFICRSFICCFPSQYFLLGPFRSYSSELHSPLPGPPPIYPPTGSFFSVATLWSYHLHCRCLSLAFKNLHNRILMRLRGKLVQWEGLGLQIQINLSSNSDFPTF